MKQLTIVIAEELHTDIKKRASGLGLTIKDWLMAAIIDRIKSEMNDEIK